MSSAPTPPTDAYRRRSDDDHIAPPELGSDSFANSVDRLVEIRARPPSPPKPEARAHPAAAASWGDWARSRLPSAAQRSAAIGHIIRYVPLYAACATTVGMIYGIKNWTFLSEAKTYGALQNLKPQLVAAHQDISCALNAIQMTLNISDSLACVRPENRV